VNAPLDGRVAIVTGASRGIGRAVARRLASRGAAVAVAARTQQAEGRLPGSIHEAVEEICAHGGTAIAVPCDVSDTTSVRALVDATRAAFGPVDILVNNAALTVPDQRPASTSPQPRLPPREVLSILSFPLEAYRRAFEVNLFGAYALTQLVLPDMIDRGRGNVVNLSSDAAHVPGEGPYPHADGVPLHAYGNSKAALEHLTRTVAYEVAARGVAVNAVLPSLPVATPGSEFAAGGNLGVTLDMERFVDAVQLLCQVAASELTGVVGYSEDLLEPAKGRRGWLGPPYL
jgi:7-alpha-hydroxysteroid dehydrogenase